MIVKKGEKDGTQIQIRFQMFITAKYQHFKIKRKKCYNIFWSICILLKVLYRSRSGSAHENSWLKAYNIICIIFVQTGFLYKKLILIVDYMHRIKFEILVLNRYLNRVITRQGKKYPHPKKI